MTTRTTAPAVEETWAEKVARLRLRKPAETWLTVPDDASLQEVADLRTKFIEARSAARDKVPAAGTMTAAEIESFIKDDATVKKAHKALEDAISRSTSLEVTFHLRALPADVYDAFASDHPPTDAQAAKDLVFNPDTYVPAMMSASVVDPLTVEDAKSLITPDPETGAVAFNRGDVAALIETIRDLNERPRMMLGKGSRPTAD